MIKYKIIKVNNINSISNINYINGWIEKTKGKTNKQTDH